MIDVPQIPLNRLLGITRNDQVPPSMQLDEVPQIHNHIGTIHACAQFALAEAASGECLLHVFGDYPDVPPYYVVLRAAETKYRASASGRLHTFARLRDKDAATLLATFCRKGKVLIAVTVDVLDEQDVVTMIATFTWYVRKLENVE